MQGRGAAASIVAVVFFVLAPAAVAGMSPTERALVRELSHVRVKHGLSPLKYSPSLARSAGRYSRWQLRNGYFGHQRRIRASRSFSVRGEVLRKVRGWRVGVRRTVRLWMRSPPHRRVLLYPSMRYVGAGIAKGRWFGPLALIVTAHFGAR